MVAGPAPASGHTLRARREVVSVSQTHRGHMTTHLDRALQLDQCDVIVISAGVVFGVLEDLSVTF